ncbi:hypothetical protein DSECCO2_243100 [anaerobic digester metagenome]
MAIIRRTPRRGFPCRQNILFTRKNVLPEGNCHSIQKLQLKTPDGGICEPVHLLYLCRNQRVFIWRAGLTFIVKM